MSRSTMTGASMNVGNQIGTRSSTKVHGPPGGHSSISFGWGAPEVPRREERRPEASPYTPATTSGMYGMPMPAAASSSAVRSVAAPVAVPAPAPAPTVRADSRDNAYYGMAAPLVKAEAPVTTAEPRSIGLSSNAYASGANQNSGNVLTDRRTTRVLSAPGGHSSIVLG